mmetsp:Transcript_7730/g.10131  ORF Transcript_7730/g.10131 Transcript_7730/m.10131 type:complete len:80 (-) Transcript_7730:160-399(-)
MIIHDAYWAVDLPNNLYQRCKNEGGNEGVLNLAIWLLVAKVRGVLVAVAARRKALALNRLADREAMKLFILDIITEEGS